MPRRLFIALPLPADLTKVLETYRDSQSASMPYLRWLPAVNWHITLVFLGEVEAAALDDVIRCLESCCKNQPPLELQSGEPTYAPPYRPSSMVWIPWHDTGRFSQFTNGIYQALRRLALTKPDLFRDFLAAPALPFRAHITVAKFGVERMPTQLAPLLTSGIEDKTVAFGSVMLYESHLQSGEPEYQVLHTISLAN